MGLGPITSSITSSGVNPSGLGCWSWFCLQGHAICSVCIICGYCPVEKEKSHLQNIYSQQKHHLESLGNLLCPQLAFFHNLSVALLPWQANGNICQPEISDFCRAHSLQEAVMSAHPHPPSCPPLCKAPAGVLNPSMASGSLRISLWPSPLGVPLQ